MRRMAVSVGPPGGKGMMNSTGRVGYPCASTPGGGAPSASTATSRTRRVTILMGSLLWEARLGRRGPSPATSCGSLLREARLGRRGPTPATSSGSHCIAQGKRPRAHLLGRAAERVPFRQSRPDLLGGGLRLATESRHVDARDLALTHAHVAVDDHGLDVVAD